MKISFGLLAQFGLVLGQENPEDFNDIAQVRLFMVSRDERTCKLLENMFANKNKILFCISRTRTKREQKNSEVKNIVLTIRKIIFLPKLYFFGPDTRVLPLFKNYLMNLFENLFVNMFLFENENRTRTKILLIFANKNRTRTEQEPNKFACSFIPDGEVESPRSIKLFSNIFKSLCVDFYTEKGVEESTISTNYIANGAEAIVYR